MASGCSGPVRRSLSWRVRDPAGARFDIEARPVIDPGPGEHSELMRDLHHSTVLRMAPEMLRWCPWVVSVLPGGTGRAWHADEAGALHLRHALGYDAAKDLHAHIAGIVGREGLPGMASSDVGRSVPRTVAENPLPPRDVASWRQILRRWWRRACR